MSCRSLGGQVASNIRAEMARRNVTQVPLARGVGMSQQALSRRLSGQTSFTVDEVDNIAEFLGIPVSQLMDRTDPAVSA